MEDNIVYLSEKTATSQEGKQQGKERTITGVVSDDMGPLIGVNVLVKGTSNGCITDLDGNFTLTTTEANPVLVFSYIGYKSQEISATGSASINVLMQNDTQMIEEVVVTALGIKRSEKALSYNVQQVNTDAITSNKDANFVNSLSGKVAGVNINASSSGVGGVSKVVMRGTKSIMQSSMHFMLLTVCLFSPDVVLPEVRSSTLGVLQNRLPTSTRKTSSQCQS